MLEWQVGRLTRVPDHVSHTPSPNFAYLAHHDARLVALATQAEEHFAGDPTITLFKLRQFGEILAQRAAAKVGLFLGDQEGQQQLIDRLWEKSVIGATQRTLFHDLRRMGNAAVHEGKGDHREALHQLRMTRELAVWFQRSFGNNRKFDPGPFIPPSEPGKVDSQRLTFEHGVRPTRGKNLAIAEWPTFADGKEGWADYVLFAGLQVVAVVEAKRKHKDVMGVIPQAKRYSLGYVVRGDEVLPGGSPWGPHKVPFLFATNGRPFLRQLRTKSGIWFLDVRRAENHPVPLEGWYTPEGLLDLLKQDVDDAYAKLKVEPMPYIDREYQKSAILAVEKGLEDGKRELLVAMATGTGKTRTCIGLCYRLLKTKRFRRVLFLVDRNALGKQTADAFKDLRLENLQTFTDIFDVKELALRPDRETKLQIATIQAMVKRVLGPDEERGEDHIPPVDQYDCVVVDECHRGYLLDRELSDREFLFRDEDDYISKYRRVLDHFDAVKIGLTATPAIHTKEIFGAPIFSYSYREAVVDGFLVDHEPPTRIVTKLAQDGIHYQAREEVLVLDRSTQTVNKEELPDELQFEVDAFNRRIITENFNRAVLRELVNHIDPAQDDKTLIFCATDEHADMVVLLLKEALKAKYGFVEDDAVAKITGATDRPLEALRRYRNERAPNIAVTVDLLTTGIDVPRIANLVFLRRVRSRILYEQMIGRATRLCPEIGKERFRIFDAVDLYSALKDVTDMKPVVVNPLVTFEQLAKEVLDGKDEDFRRTSLDEFLAKLQRKRRALGGEAEERFQAAAGSKSSRSFSRRAEWATPPTT
jgi:type I restriction enzyme R subunit